MHTPLAAIYTVSGWQVGKVGPEQNSTVSSSCKVSDPVTFDRMPGHSGLSRTTIQSFRQSSAAASEEGSSANGLK
jgi:hypothetical protein